MILDKTAPLTIAIHTDQLGVIIPQLFYNESSKTTKKKKIIRIL